jgi:hypothetical protein
MSLSIARPAPVVTYAKIIRHKTCSSCPGQRVVTHAQQDLAAASVSVNTPEFEACEFDPHSLQPHWGTKLINDVLHGSETDLSSEQLLNSARRAVTAFTERIGALPESLGALRSKMSSSVDSIGLPSMPSVRLPAVELPSLDDLPSLPSTPTVDLSGAANMVGRTKDFANNAYQKAYESTQNVVADRVDRLSSDLSSTASEKGEGFSFDVVNRAATTVVDDLHAIKAALDNHNLVFFPTLEDAVNALSQHSQLHQHFGTDLLVALSKAMAADTAVLLGELGSYIGMSKAAAVFLDIVSL